MSNYNIPWSPGYAIPAYVQAEPPGRGTFTTAYAPRGQISQLVPDYLMDRSGSAVMLAQRGGMGDAGDGTIYTGKRGGPMCGVPGKPRCGPLHGLGAVDIAPGPKPGFPGDPIAGYGREVARKLLTRLRFVPAKDRQTALHSLLDKIDPTLWSKVEMRAGELERTMRAPAALEKALASALADGFARELVNIGLTGRLPNTGQTAMGIFGPQAMGNIFGDVWDKVSGAAETVGHYAKEGAQIVGSASCRALNSPASGIAAGAAGAAFGVPPVVGAAGAQMASSAACSSGRPAGAHPPAPRPPVVTTASPSYAIAQQPQYVAPAPAGSSFPIVPVAIGAAAIVGVLLLRRK